MPSLFTREQGEALSAISQKEGKSLPCHLALDTGMGRIGIQVEKEGAVELGLELFSLTGIEICGIFSHFSCCDDRDKSYTEMQERRFADYLKALEERGIKASSLSPFQLCGNFRGTGSAVRYGAGRHCDVWVLSLQGHGKKATLETGSLLEG